MWIYIWELFWATLKAQCDVLFTLQINILFSIVITDSFTVFSDCSYIKQLNFLPSSICSIGSISLIGGAGTERKNKLTGSEKGLARTPNLESPDGAMAQQERGQAAA